MRSEDDLCIWSLLLDDGYEWCHLLFSSLTISMSDMLTLGIINDDQIRLDSSTGPEILIYHQHPSSWSRLTILLGPNLKVLLILIIQFHPFLCDPLEDVMDLSLRDI
jgi:hypothetical protein